jgi:Protein of unknown function (DUF4199)
MKKIVLTFGLISGAILSAMMLLTLAFTHTQGYDYGELFGYSTMVLAFLLIFFGVRSYRDNVGGGRVGFWRALAVGSLIAFVSSACYVATWEAIYFTVMPDFMSKYEQHELQRAREKGASEAVLAQKKAEMDHMAVMYKNPAFNVAITFMEPLPVGLVIALFSAGVLSRRKKVRPEDGGVLAGAGAAV